jgi:Cu(I)/Ag(I) efflux system membrane fusion protein
VTVNLTPVSRKEALLVPTEAVIQTGKRTVVVVADSAQDGKQQFLPVDVEIGTESNGMTEIRKGLARGQKVVVSGQFLIDSESSLKATATRLAEAPSSMGETHSAEGRVEKIGKDAVTISHGPVPSLQWGAMTMDFKPPTEGLPAGVKEGGTVSFEFKSGGKGDFQITAIKPTRPAMEMKDGAKR